MGFLSPSWVPKLPEIPDVPLHEFMFDEQFGCAPFHTSLPAYVCGVTGREVTISALMDNVDGLARGLATELGWQPNKGEEMSKAIAIFALNTACLQFA
jgi:ribosome assembly protein SQT1